MMKRYSIACLLLLSACSYLPDWLGGSAKEITRLPGERQEVIPQMAELEPDAAEKAAPFHIPAAAENADWAQHSGQFTPATSNLSVKGFESHQDVSVGDGDDFSNPLIPRPVVGDGKLFAMDGKGYISAHKVDDIGSVLWKSTVLVGKKEPDVMGGGLAYDGGKIYVTSGIGAVVAIDAADGKEIWRNALGTPLRSAPKIASGKLFAITMDNQTFALDLATGKTLWTHRGINETAGVMNTLSPAIAGSNLITPYSSGELYALSLENGDEIWRESPAQARRTEAGSVFAGIGGDPVIDETVVMSVSSGGGFLVLNALSGQRAWAKPFSSVNTPWVTGDYIYLLSADNVLYCMKKFTGVIRWKTALKGFEDEKHRLKPINWSGPIMVNGKIMVVSGHGEMKLFDAADGTLAQTIDIPGKVFTTPIVAAGHLFFITQDAKLYSYP